MTFKRGVPYNFTGPSYQSRSRPLSSQKTQNFYHQIVEEGSSQYVLHSWPGLKSESSVTAGASRGQHTMKGVAYRVVGQTLYSFDSAGAHTTIGTVPGATRLVMTDDGLNLVMVDPGVSVYIYNGSSIVLVTNANIIGAIAATFINNQVVYTKPDFFVVAAVGDPTTANGLDQAGAESQPDDLLHAYAFQQLVYMIGTESNEPYWNSSTGNPPFERMDGQIMEVGMSATHSVANTDEAMYWLGDDYAVYRASGGIKQRISSVALSHAITGYSMITDAVGSTLTLEGQNFYLLTFPAACKTWCLAEALGDKGWFELSSGTNGGVYQAPSAFSAYGKTWLSDASNGALYSLDIDAYTNNGNAIQRQRVGGAIDGKMAGAPGAEVEIDGMKIIMETGVGLISGQGEDPKIVLELSFDGGYTWNQMGWADVGRLGERKVQVQFDFMETFHSAIPRITTTDPVHYTIFGATVNLRRTGGK